MSLFFLVASCLQADEVSFRKDLVPILARRCLGCHNNRKAEGRYALHTFQQLLHPGDSEQRPIVANKPDQSYLLTKLLEADESERMPQEDDPLTPPQIELFAKWIADGAKFDGSSPTDRLTTLLPPRQHPQPPAKYRIAAPVFALKFSVDGESLYSAGLHELLVWDVNTGLMKRRIAGLPQRIHAICQHPTREDFLFVGGGAPGDYGEIRSIDLKSGRVTAVAVWEDVILDLAISGDGQRLAAGGADNSVRVYQLFKLQTARALWRSQQHVDWVTALTITDYRFLERYVGNDDLPDFFVLNQHEKASGQHVRQHWQFDAGDYIVRESNWELAGRGKDLHSLTKITVSGIGKTYQVIRTPIDSSKWPEHAKTIDYLRSLHAGLNERNNNKDLSSSFVITASRDRTAKVFSLRDGQLFTTYKGHRREYGPLKGMHRLFSATAEPGSRRVWTGGEGHHFHGWDPVIVRDEDGTAADMEARFAKKYSVDHVRHDFADTVLSGALARAKPDTYLLASSADGSVKRLAVSGPKATFDVNKTGVIATYQGLQDHLFAVDVHAGKRRVAAAGYSGNIAIWQFDKPKPLIFRAAP